jgi:hypothetical protein
MTPRGERRHYLTKACSTALGCQQSKKKKFYLVRLIMANQFIKFMKNLTKKLCTHLRLFVHEIGTMIGHVWSVVRAIVAIVMCL